MRAHGSLGGKKDVWDDRDHWLEIPRAPKRTLPKRVDLRRHFPPVYSQGHIEACSANVIAAAMWFHGRIHREDRTALNPSRLFIYYNSRRLGHNVYWNAPVSLRVVYKAVRKWGACGERLWPYNPGRFRVRPLERCYAAGQSAQVVRYARLRRDLFELRACLAQKYPFALGISLYDSFRHDPAVKRRGIVPMPHASEREIGAHAVLAVGYDDRARHFILRNSWGGRWGDGGYFYLPYDFFTHRIGGRSVAWDFWTIRDVD